MQIDGKTLGLLFELRDRLQDRVDGIPAQSKTLPKYLSDGTEVKTVGHVATALSTDLDTAYAYVEEVKARVRTAAGMRRYKLPMGAHIPGTPFETDGPPVHRSPNSPVRVSRSGRKKPGRFGSMADMTLEEVEQRVTRNLGVGNDRRVSQAAREQDDEEGRRRALKPKPAAVAAARVEKPEENNAGKTVYPTPAKDDPYLMAAEKAARLLRASQKRYADRFGKRPADQKPDYPLHSEQVRLLEGIIEAIKQGQSINPVEFARVLQSAALATQKHQTTRPGLHDEPLSKAIRDLADVVEVHPARKWVPTPGATPRPAEEQAPRGVSVPKKARDQYGRITGTYLRGLKKAELNALHDKVRASVVALLSEPEFKAGSSDKKVRPHRQARVQAELKAYSDDMDAVRAEFKRRRWFLPPLPSKKKGVPRKNYRGKDVREQLMTPKQVAELNALNDEGRKMYASRRFDGASHDVALSNARGDQPYKAQWMSLDKGRNNQRTKKRDDLGEFFLATVPTGQPGEGESYAIRFRPDAPVERVDPKTGKLSVVPATTGQWYATYYTPTGRIQEVFRGTGFKDEEAVLASLEQWHERWHARFTRGKIRPIWSKDAPWTLGDLKSKKRTRTPHDTYAFTGPGGIPKYTLLFDGEGWIVTFKPDRGPDKGQDVPVTGVHWAMPEDALNNAMAVYRAGSWRKKPVAERFRMSAAARKTYSELSEPAKRVYIKARGEMQIEVDNDGLDYYRETTHVEAMRAVRRASNAGDFSTAGTRTGTSARSGSRRKGATITRETIEKFVKLKITDKANEDLPVWARDTIAVIERSFGVWGAPTAAELADPKSRIEYMKVRSRQSITVLDQTADGVRVRGRLKRKEVVLFMQGGTRITVYPGDTLYRQKTTAEFEADKNTPGELDPADHAELFKGKKRNKPAVEEVLPDKPTAAELRAIEEEKALPKIQTCSEKDCKNQATVRVIWAEGMAYQPACDDHIDAVKHRLEVGQKYGPVDAVRPIKDVYGGSMPGGSRQGPGARIILERPGALRRRRRRALDRCRDILRKKALDDLAAFMDMYESKARESETHV